MGLIVRESEITGGDVWHGQYRVAKVIVMEACMLFMYDGDGEMEGFIVYEQTWIVRVYNLLRLHLFGCKAEV